VSCSIARVVAAGFDGVLLIRRTEYNQLKGGVFVSSSSSLSRGSKRRVVMSWVYTVGKSE